MRLGNKDDGYLVKMYFLKMYFFKSVYSEKGTW